MIQRPSVLYKLRFSYVNGTYHISEEI